MEEIIGEHIISIDVFRNFKLIFNVDLLFIEKNNRIFILDKINYEKLIYQEVIYQTNLEEGFSIYRHLNGQKSSEGYYRNGRLEGLWIQWYSNGQKFQEGKYRNGKENGLWITWMEDGRKLDEIYFRDGIVLDRIQITTVAN